MAMGNLIDPRPVTVVSELVDLGQVEAVGGPPENAVFLPEGRELDAPLRRAIVKALAALSEGETRDRSV
jgi:hypothetical protein